jgi:hypothetical protein
MNHAETALHEARRLVEVPDLHAALVVVRAALRYRNPYLHNVDPTMCELAELYVDLAKGDPPMTGVIDWAVYLHRATRTGQSAALLTDLAYQRGTPAGRPAMPAPRPASGLPAADRVAERFAVVALLHACDLYGPARRETLAALAQWEPHHDQAPEVTYTHLADAIAAAQRLGRRSHAKSLLAAYGGLLPASWLTTRGSYSIPVYDEVPGRLGQARSAVRHIGLDSDSSRSSAEPGSPGT